MKAKPTPEECQAILRQKLSDLHEDLGDEQTNFKASFALTLPRSPVIADINNDLLREQEFQAVTLEGVNRAREFLNQCKIPYLRPATMFAEMMKTEGQMDKIRQRLAEQKEKKEKLISRNEQKKEVKTAKGPAPRTKRPGVSMKPHKGPKQQKRDKAKSKPNRPMSH
jgi:hypothetical protein